MVLHQGRSEQIDLARRRPDWFGEHTTEATTHDTTHQIQSQGRHRPTAPAVVTLDTALVEIKRLEPLVSATRHALVEGRHHPFVHQEFQEKCGNDQR